MKTYQPPLGPDKELLHTDAGHAQYIPQPMDSEEGASKFGDKAGRVLRVKEFSSYVMKVKFH